MKRELTVLLEQDKNNIHSDIRNHPVSLTVKCPFAEDSHCPISIYFLAPLLSSNFWPFQPATHLSQATSVHHSEKFKITQSNWTWNTTKYSKVSRESRGNLSSLICFMCQGSYCLRSLAQHISCTQPRQKRKMDAGKYWQEIEFKTSEARLI